MSTKQRVNGPKWRGQTVKAQSDAGLAEVAHATSRLWRKHHLSYDQTKYVVERARRALGVEPPRTRRRTVQRLDYPEVERLIRSAVDPDRLYNVETDPGQAEDAKPPYDTVKMKGRAEGRFIFSTALSRHLLPFALLPPPAILLPCQVNQQGALTVLTADELRSKGYREFAKWMSEAETIWNAARKQKAERQTLYQRLDYQRELTIQNLSHPHLVLYNAVGTNLSAAVADRNALPLPFVVDHRLYWAAFETEEEAHYLAAIINSNVPNDEIKPFQSLGLMGERDIHKKVLELPIPFFDAKKPNHRNLANLSTTAHRRAAAYIAATALPDSLAKSRGMIRQAVNEIIDHIDTIVAGLLA